ncbi:hypothetical protein J6590_104082, partial [Homalodisca vitripennis]
TLLITDYQGESILSANMEIKTTNPIVLSVVSYHQPAPKKGKARVKESKHHIFVKLARMSHPCA